MKKYSHWCYETIKLRPNSPPLMVAVPCTHTWQPLWEQKAPPAPEWMTQAVREMLASQKKKQADD